jgi:hypothetical protein
MKIEDELLPLLLEVLTLRLHNSYNTVAAIMMTAGTLKKPLQVLLMCLGGDVTVNVSKIIPLQVFLS